MSTSSGTSPCTPWRLYCPTGSRWSLLWGDLQSAGIDIEHVRILQGGEGVRILDRTGVDHGFLDGLVRAMQSLGYDQNILAVYDEGLKAGQALVTVPCASEQRYEVGNVLRARGRAQHHLLRPGHGRDDERPLRDNPARVPSGPSTHGQGRDQLVGLDGTNGAGVQLLGEVVGGEAARLGDDVESGGQPPRSRRTPNARRIPVIAIAVTKKRTVGAFIEST
jgi:hypothetical protein